jgi:hypothetical protein
MRHDAWMLSPLPDGRSVLLNNISGRAGAPTPPGRGNGG